MTPSTQFDSVLHTLAALVLTLSGQELAVATRIAHGQTTKEIAAAMSLSPETVRTYRKALMRKLHVHNAAQLISRLNPTHFKMTYTIARRDSEINDQLNRAAAWEERGGSSVRGQTYEQGVQAALAWIIGNTDETPIEEEPPE